MTDLPSLSPESCRIARVAIQVVAFLGFLIALLHFSNPASAQGLFVEECGAFEGAIEQVICEEYCDVRECEERAYHSKHCEGLRIAFFEITESLLICGITPPRGSTALTKTHDVACDCTIGASVCECDVNTKIKLHELEGKNVKMQCTNQSGLGQVFISADVDNNFEEFCADWVLFDAQLCADANAESCETYCFNPDLASNHSVEVKTIICGSAT